MPPPRFPFLHLLIPWFKVYWEGLERLSVNGMIIDSDSESSERAKPLRVVHDELWAKIQGVGSVSVYVQGAEGGALSSWEVVCDNVDVDTLFLPQEVALGPQSDHFLPTAETVI